MTDRHWSWFVTRMRQSPWFPIGDYDSDAAWWIIQKSCPCDTVSSLVDGLSSVIPKMSNHIPISSVLRFLVSGRKTWFHGTPVYSVTLNSKSEADLKTTGNKFRILSLLNSFLNWTCTLISVGINSNTFFISTPEAEWISNPTGNFACRNVPNRADKKQDPTRGIQ